MSYTELMYKISKEILTEISTCVLDEIHPLTGSFHPQDGSVEHHVNGPVYRIRSFMQ